MQKRIIIILFIIFLISCQTNKEHKKDATTEYHNLKLNFRQGVTKHYKTKIYILINSIDIAELNDTLKNIIGQYTNKKNINSVKALLELESSKSIEEVDQGGIATIHSKVNKLSIEDLKINKEKLNIYFPYDLPINKGNILKIKISPKNKILELNNSALEKSPFFNIMQIINKQQTLPKRIKIGKAWKSHINDEYSNLVEDRNFKMKLNITHQSTLKKLEDDLIYISGNFGGKIKGKIRLDYASLSIEINLEGTDNIAINNMIGLEEKVDSNANFVITTRLLPYNENEYLDKIKFTIKGTFKYVHKLMQK